MMCSTIAQDIPPDVPEFRIGLREFVVRLCRRPTPECTDLPDLQATARAVRTYIAGHAIHCRGWRVALSDGEFVFNRMQ
jgi:hypothetical protein